MGKKTALIQFHRETIAAAADGLFLAHGMEATTMDDIARAAQYSKATLYVYFKSKDDIFHYLVIKGMTVLHDMLERALAANTGAINTYYAICAALADYADRYPLYFGSILALVPADADRRGESQLLQELYVAGETLNGDIEVLLQRGVAQGVFRSDLPHVGTGLVHWAALSGIIVLAGKKQNYIAESTGMTGDAFMQFGFELMLRSITKPDVCERRGEE